MTFEEAHRGVLHLFPSHGAAVLDVGAGSGRDAAALAARGHRVVAAEPSAQLRALGQQLHGDQDIEWTGDALPTLHGLRGSGRRFELILLTAVWMHLDEEERASAMRHLTGLLAPGGRLVLCLRHGPVPAGRRMFDVSAQETVALARLHGLGPVHLGERGDLHGRAGVHWSELVLGKPGTAPV